MCHTPIRHQVGFPEQWEEKVISFAQREMAKPDYADFSLMRKALLESRIHVSAIRPAPLVFRPPDDEEDEEGGCLKQCKKCLACSCFKRPAERRPRRDAHGRERPGAPLAQLLSQLLAQARRRLVWG